MQNTDVYFSRGDRMNIEIVEGNVHYCVSATFWSYEDEQWLLLNAKSSMPVAVDAEKKVTIRYCNGKNAFSFHSEIMEFGDKANNQFLIKPPTGVESRTTRSGHRVPIPPELCLTMTDGENAFPVKMRDLSEKGACLVSNSRLGCIGETFSIELHPSPSSDIVKLSCEIRYIRKDLSNDSSVSTYCHGIKFGRLDTIAERFIEFYLKDKLVSLS